MRAGDAAVCPGTAFHRRVAPTNHEFRAPLELVWLDPDDPAALCRHHPLWSAARTAPVRFRRRDYGAEPTGSLAAAARRDLAGVLGGEPAGEVRMLTQLRRWGWLFNPITVFVAWHVDPDRPAGLVLEVTNTPWKERHRYPVTLTGPDGDGWMTGTTDKRLHVSPFLDESYRYDVALRAIGDEITLRIDVADVMSDAVTLETAMTVERRPATRRALAAAMRRNPAPTHRVSLGIHAQALRLWRKRVPFVVHPSKRTVPT